MPEGKVGPGDGQRWTRIDAWRKGFEIVVITQDMVAEEIEKIQQQLLFG